MRAETLQAVIGELTRDEDAIDATTARGLVKSAKGPADLSLAALAKLTKQTKGTVKTRVIEGRQRLAEGEKVRAALALRGYVSAETLGARDG